MKTFAKNVFLYADGLTYSAVKRKAVGQLTTEYLKWV